MEFHPLYANATELSLKSHRPPEPFGKTGYKHVKTPGVLDISPATVGHLNQKDLIYALHPRERYEPSIMPMPSWFIDNQQTIIKIVGQLSSNDQGAQVVICQVLHTPDVLWKKMGYKTHDLPRKVVAKIFDPLHYHGYVDPVAEADREYAQEAAAFVHLHDKRDTKTYTDKPDLVPHFYGTWTMDITFDHFRKNVMSSAARQQKLKAEGEKRKQFDAAVAAAANNNGDPSQQPKLVAQSFRPIRVILTQHVDGSPLWQHLTKAVDDTNNPIVKPRKKFKQEEVRLDIFGNMLDTISRLEYLGVKLPTVTTRAPPVFLITEKINTTEPDNNIVTAEASKGKEREIVNVVNPIPVKHGVVMTDFTQADVACYTDIGYDLDEKLPLPSHPLSSYEIDEYLCLRGWYPPEWMFDVDKYHEWAESYFKSSNYADPETMKRIIKEVGWYEDLKKFGREPPEQDDPKWQEHLKTLWADAPDAWKNFTLPTAEEYRQRMGASKETLRSLREKEEAEDLKTRISDFHRIKKSRALEEYKKKFGQRPSDPKDPEWRKIVDVETHADSLWRRGLSCFRYEVDSDGNLNPTLLQIAKYGHYLESQVLEISAELHMFGTGNPRFEVHQAAGVAVIIGSMALFLFWQMAYLVLLLFHDMPLLNYLGMAVILLGSDVVLHIVGVAGGGCNQGEEETVGGLESSKSTRMTCHGTTGQEIVVASELRLSKVSRKHDL
ncbi:hypothetical protein B0T11DRAFT_330557 [Plectosphaerella cucumerina]|uniref:Uncharacterized protein n=1 Tax=Plectosphaerella cucumerina TaxID=40658 RepID=A0A8K0TFX9_9PEZI|nr:hypothetical protein B0T11DRAFT_330557 [Plectosphaerella cucumerina]